MFKEPRENCVSEVVFQEQVTYLQPPEFSAHTKSVA